MTEKNARTKSGAPALSGAELRDARLKLALKANMARRKAQAKQRGAGEGPADLQAGSQQDASAVSSEKPDTGVAAQDRRAAGSDVKICPDTVSGSTPQPGTTSGTQTPPGAKSGTPTKSDTGSGTQTPPDETSGK